MIEPTNKQLLQDLYEANCDNYFEFMDAVYETFPEWNKDQAHYETEFLFKE